MTENQTPAQYFESNVDKSTGHGPAGECWLWVGSVTDKGYGVAFFDGKRMLAHRLSFLLGNGSINQALQVLHRCDTPNCVNPAHLKQGTNKDNNDDMLAKGRHYRQGTTACQKGHEYVEGSYFLDAKGARNCLICKRNGRKERAAVITQPKAPQEINPQRTHCAKGHAFTPENTRVRSGGNGKVCIACFRVYDLNRKKQKAIAV